MRLWELSYIKSATKSAQKILGGFFIAVFPYFPHIYQFPPIFLASKTSQNGLMQKANTEKFSLPFSFRLHPPPSPASLVALARPDFWKNMQFVPAFPVLLACLAILRLLLALFPILPYSRKNSLNFDFSCLDVYLYHYNIKLRVWPFKRSYWETSFFSVFIVWLFSSVFRLHVASLFCFRILQRKQIFSCASLFRFMIIIRKDSGRKQKNKRLFSPLVFPCVLFSCFRFLI